MLAQRLSRRLADLVAGYLDIKPLERQQLLEMLSVEDRLRRHHEWHRRKVRVAERDWRDYLETLKTLYSGRRDVMLRALEEHFGGRARWTTRFSRSCSGAASRTRQKRQPGG